MAELITYSITGTEAGGSLVEPYPFWIWNNGRVYNFCEEAGEYPTYDGFPDDSPYWRRVADEGKKLISLKIQSILPSGFLVNMADELPALVDKFQGVTVSVSGAKFEGVTFENIGDCNLVGCFLDSEATEDVRVIALVE